MAQKREETREFEQNRLYVVSLLICSIGIGLCSIVNVFLGLVSMFILKMQIYGLLHVIVSSFTFSTSMFILLHSLWQRAFPYIRASKDEITIIQTIIKRPLFIIWDSIQAVNYTKRKKFRFLEPYGRLELALSNNTVAKIYMHMVNKNDREELMSLFKERLEDKCDFNSSRMG